MATITRFCPSCQGALLKGRCRRCDGTFEREKVKSPARRGGATFGKPAGGASGLDRFRGGNMPTARPIGQAALSAAGVQTGDGNGPPRSATRWEGSTAGQPHEVLGLFPFDTIRDGQRDLTRHVQRAVRRGEHLVAHAPTGLGKTAASVAPALHAGLDAGKRVLVLTSKQSQHRIVVDTLRRITETRGARFAAVDVIGKRDMCPRPEKDDMPAFAFPEHCNRLCRTSRCEYFKSDATAAVEETREGIHHVEELIDISLNHTCCPHKVAMEASKKADVIVCDYNYLFSDLRERILEAFQCELSDLIVVVDEAHNLPDRVRANFSLEMTQFRLDEARLELRRNGDAKAERGCKVLQQQLDGLAEALDNGDEEVLAKSDLIEPFEAAMGQGSLPGQGYSFKQFIEALKANAQAITKGARDGAVVSRCGELEEFLAGWLYGGKSHARVFRKDIKGGWRLQHTLLDPGHICGPIFAGVHSAIVMSGTLYPPEMYRDMLGLEPERSKIKIYTSPFDAANRPVLCVKGLTTRYKDRTDAMFRKMADTIARLHQQAGGNTAAFFPSYDLMQRTLVHLQDLPFERIVETKGMGKAERDRVVDTLHGARRSRDGALLLGVLGGSLSEGVDYNDNLLRCVTVVGLPLAPPSREVDLLVQHFEKAFPGKGKDYGYTMPAMTRVLQAAGRGIRGADDRCPVVLLDERYMFGTYRRTFPADLRPVLVNDPAAVLSDFFEETRRVRAEHPLAA